MRVLRLFQLPFGASDLLLCNPKRSGRRSRATDGLGAEVAEPSESLCRRAIAVSWYRRRVVARLGARKES